MASPLMDGKRQKRLSPSAEKFIAAWSQLIGPRYARALLPIRRNVLVGIALMPAAIAMGIAVGSAAGADFSYLVGVSVGMAGIAPFVVGGVRLIRLELRIQHDLEAAGFTVKPGGPDLRDPSWFQAWSRRSNISAAKSLLLAKDRLSRGWTEGQELGQLTSTSNSPIIGGAARAMEGSTLSRGMVGEIGAS